MLGVLPIESRSALLTYTNAIPIQECCMDDTCVAYVQLYGWGALVLLWLTPEEGVARGSLYMYITTDNFLYIFLEPTGFPYVLQ